LNLITIYGLFFVLLCFGLVVLFLASDRSHPGRLLREIPAFVKLRRVVGMAVEAGTRLHVSIGRGAMTSEQSAPAFAGLSIISRVARAASISDRPPVATSGEGSLGVLTQDTLRGAYRVMGVESQYEDTSGRITGLTPFSYAAGTMPIIRDEHISINVLLGSFGSEVALIADAAEQSGSLILGGTDSLPGQAVLYATAEEPLIGEEIFAGGAYLGAGLLHEASLRMQDIMRFLIIALIILGVVLRLLGVEPFSFSR